MEQAWLPALALNPVARARNNGSYIKMTSSLTKKTKKKLFYPQNAGGTEAHQDFV